MSGPTAASDRARGMYALAAIVGSMLVFSAFVGTYREPLAAFLSGVAEQVASLGVWGYAVMAAITFVAAIPPMLGYGTVLLLSGYVFGFPWGALPCIAGAVLGAAVVFLAVRPMANSAWMARVKAAFPQLAALDRAIEKDALRFVLLLRLAPYPFNYLTVLLASTRVPFASFMLGTILSMPKILFHTYTGASLPTLAAVFSPTSASTASEGSNVVQIFSVVAAIGCGVGGAIYISNVVGKEFAAIEAESRYPCQPAQPSQPSPLAEKSE